MPMYGPKYGGRSGSRQTWGAKQSARRWKDRNPDKIAGYIRKMKYGITEEAYEALLVKQNGRCAICKREPNGKRLAVDHDHHDHRTGVVRGLLCHSCNLLLGLAKDDPEILHLAAGYLLFS